MDTPEPLEEIPANELISVFSHAIGVHRKLVKIAEEIGRFDIESFDTIGKELNWLKGSLEEIGPHTSNLPPKIRTHAVAVKDIVNDACWKKSYGDICMSFFESNLAEHGNAGWEEVLQLTQEPAISWGEPPQPNSTENGTAGAVQAEVVPTEKQPKKATVNERMKAEMAGNLETVKGWTAKKWAEHLKCGSTSVKDTETWKSLVSLRAESKAEKQMDRHRR